MIQLPKEFDSVFRYIVVVSQRAEQIIKGAKPRTDSRRAKPTLIARDDVEGGQVNWRVLTQEELDAHRQALVEQFRAEMEAANERDLRQAIPDVLPTASVEEIADEDEDRDDELLRLQKLLGMSRGAKREVADGELAADDDEDADEEIDLDDDFDAEEEG
ncbi:MAG: DNA-directed RNA polymerase subunit omega [Thermoanaerobaculales bacterium]|jgi:DNA-directed RNA polymerase subunit K/omega|nr:DNA-directed RNA polymerase subunit omega [Thermoanaerobaculales bacterium]